MTYYMRCPAAAHALADVKACFGWCRAAKEGQEARGGGGFVGALAGIVINPYPTPLNYFTVSTFRGLAVLAKTNYSIVPIPP